MSDRDTPADSIDAVAVAVRAIEDGVAHGHGAPSLAALATSVHLSASALREAFVARLGVTPKAYAAQVKSERLRRSLADGTAVAEALYDAGFGSPSRVYERRDELLGMSPAAYRKGAPGEVIGYTLVDTSLGRLIVGTTSRGVCLIAFGESDDDLIADAATRFPRATLRPAEKDAADLVAAVVALVDHSGAAVSAALPLDIRGTAFQQRVWQALTRIEPGETVTYGELARRIGKPSAVRAVAQACGANPLAIAVPCHRVVGSDGSLTGYRWGVDRKRALLERERSRP